MQAQILLGWGCTVDGLRSLPLKDSPLELVLRGLLALCFDGLLSALGVDEHFLALVDEPVL